MKEYYRNERFKNSDVKKIWDVATGKVFRNSERPEKVKI